MGKRKKSDPLAQAIEQALDSETREAIEDWHYWVSQGYEF